MTEHPGSWVSQTIEALQGQDYPNLSLSALVRHDDDDTIERISASASVWNRILVASDVGFGSQVNSVLVDSDAELFLVVRDDVALQPGAISALVREYLRRESPPTVVGPKLVDWNDPSRLMPSGFEADRFAMTSPKIHAGDRDQGQHDRAESVFGLSSACLLMARPVLQDLGGYDDAMRYFGEGYDLAARVRHVGGQIVLVPAAVARHRGDFGSRVRASEEPSLRKHRLRSILTSTPNRDVVPSIVGLALIHLVEIVVSIVRLDSNALHIVKAWVWNIARLPSALARRRQMQVASANVEAKTIYEQVRLARRRGSIRLSDSVDRRITQREAASERGEETISAIRAVGAAVVGLIVVFGARHLLTRPIPAVGEFRMIPDDLGTLSAAWWSAWRDSGMGFDGYAPFAYPVLDVLGLGAFGSAGLLRAILIVAPLPLGVVGAWRLFSGSASRSASVMAAAVYAASPLPYGAYAGGSWSAMVIYASAPWVLASLIGAMGQQTSFGIHRRRGTASIALATAMALLTAFTTASFLLLAILSFGLVAGSLLGGDLRRIGRYLAAAAVAGAVAFAMNAPHLLQTESWSEFFSVESTEAHSMALLDLMTFQTGSVGSLLTGGAAIGLGLVPAFFGNGATFSWAMRSWGIALSTWGIAWAGIQGWLPFSLPVLESLLVPAALALAVLGGLSAQVLESEAPRGEGKQAVLLLLTIGAFSVAALPMIQGATSGRWELARADLSTSFGAAQAPLEEGSYRVLWVGDAHVLASASVPTTRNLAWTTSLNGVGTVESLWGIRNQGLTADLGDTIAAGLEGRTSRLGRDLASFGVRYIVVVDQQAPVPEISRRVEVSQSRAFSLSAQLDLVRTGVVNPAVAVYENTAWAPVHSGIAEVDLEPLRLDDTAPVLTERLSHELWGGQTRVARQVYSAIEPSPRWTLSIDGTVREGTAAGGKGLSFVAEDVIDPTSASLQYTTPTSHRIVVAIQACGFVFLIGLRRWAHGRERRGKRRIETAVEVAS